MMNFIRKLTPNRRMSACIVPYDIKNIPTPNLDVDNMNYFGLIKNLPHYINKHNQVYCRHDNGEIYEYVADWCNERERLTTEKIYMKEIYKTYLFNEKYFFYDIDFYDAYHYLDYKKIVIPVGFWDNNQKKILFNYNVFRKI